MASDATQLQRGLRRRLEELDAQLAGLDGLRAERNRVAGALEALAGASRKPTRSSRTARTGSRGKGRRAPRRKSGASNSERIVAHLKERGSAATAGDVSVATGIKRTTVATTMSQLARAGTLAKADRGYTVAPTGTGG